MKPKIARVVGLVLLAVGLLEAPASDLVLWYNSPGTVNMTQGLLLGNGRMGAIVPGNVTNESIVLNEDSLWAGNTNVQGGYTYDGQRGPTGAFGAYQTFGNLLINLPGQTGYTGYTRTLDLNTGVATATYTNGGVAYTRTLFCSAPDQVLVVQLTASAAAAYTGSITLADGHPTNTVNFSSVAGGLAFSGALFNGELYEAQLQITNNGGTLVNSGGVINFTNCNSLLLVVALGTSYSQTNYQNNYVGTNPHTNVLAQAQAAIGKSFSTLLTAHTNNFTPLANRVSINLGTGPASVTNLPTDQRLSANKTAGDNDPGMDALLFAYGRYMMISASRGALPMNLQGLWNDSNNPNWASDYHGDLNFQMCYSAEEVANLSECFLPFVNYLQSQIPVWRYFTTNTSSSINNNSYQSGTFGGTNGWATRSAANIYGGMGGWWIEGANAWYCMYLWDHYAFTGDTNYLRNSAYPIMKEVCQFWQQHLKALPTAVNGVPAGTLVVTNGWSPETGPREDGVTGDQELVWDVFNNYQQACSILNTDAVFSATVSNLQANLLLPRVGPWGELREWFYNADGLGAEPGCSEMQFCGLYPGRQITPEASPSLAAAARVRLLAMGSDGGYEWAYAQHIWFFARLHDWWSAKRALAGEYNDVLPNLCGLNQVAQMDSCMGVTAGIAEMLLQSHAGYINLLPALPDAWPAGSFTGLCARGGYTVSAAWTNAAATATISASITGTCAVHTPNPVTVTSNGTPVTVTSLGNGTVQWPVTAGGTYALQWVLPPFPAQLPSPMDYAASANLGTQLSWLTSGANNYQHNVYFGTSSNAVFNATTNSPEYQGRTSATNLSLPMLQPNTTYFWRVDEISGTNTGTGVLWQFTTCASFAATNPVPAVGEGNVPFTAALSWTPGTTPNTNCLHDVYFGTSSNAVANATTNSAEYQGRRAVANFTPVANLLTNTTYLWRVDEIVGQAVSPGSVWTFTTARDAIHNSLSFYFTLDSRDVLGATNIFDRSGTPPNNGTLNPSGSLPGFTAGKVGEALVLNGSSQYAAAPAPNVSTANATFLCWLNRNGAQSSSAGIMFCRGGTTVSGLNFYGANNTLSYHWNDDPNTYGYNSGLTPPANQWAFCALVVTPTNAVFYLGTTNGILTSATHTYAHVLEAFDAPLLLGSDSYSSSRYFNGAMDEAYFWTRSLAPAEITAFFTNGLNSITLDGSAVAQPGSYTWTGSLSTNWANSTNWSSAAVPGAANTAIFDFSSLKNLNTDLGGAQSVAGIQVSGPLAAVGIASASGAALTLGAGGLILSNTAATLTLSAPVVLGASQTWNIVDNGTLTVSGVVSGANSLTKSGAGTLTLAGNNANTYTGTTTVSGGALIVDNNNSGKTTTLSSSAIAVNGASTVLFKSTAGAGGRNDMTGKTFTFDTAGGGTITSSMNNFLISGAVTTRGGQQDYITGGKINLNGGTFTFNVARGNGVSDLLVSAALWNTSAANAVTKTGNGILTLNGANTYTGGTAINSGALVINGSLTSPVTVNNSGTFAGNGTISGTVTVNGGGTLRVVNAAAGIGTLTLGSSLTLNSTATNILCLSKNGGVLTNDLVGVSGALTLGGTLVVTNIGTNALASGDTFKLFNAASYSGAFTNHVLPQLANGLVWNTSQLAVNGTLAAIAIVPPAIFSPVALRGGGYQLTFSGNNGQTYRVLASPDVKWPMANWLVLTNGTFGTGPATFSDSTATNNAGFYRVVSP